MIRKILISVMALFLMTAGAGAKTTAKELENTLIVMYANSMAFAVESQSRCGFKLTAHSHKAAKVFRAADTKTYDKEYRLGAQTGNKAFTEGMKNKIGAMRLCAMVYTQFGPDGNLFKNLVKLPE